jgi:hypothetical protein
MSGSSTESLTDAQSQTVLETTLKFTPDDAHLPKLTYYPCNTLLLPRFVIVIICFMK